MVRFIHAADALQEVERIHQLVDPKDGFESDLYESVIEVATLLTETYQAAEITEKELNKDLLELFGMYFESYEKVGFLYKVS